MRAEDSHVPDEELLLAADGELAGAEAARVRVHLEACWVCRARMAELEGTISEFVRVYRGELDGQLPPGGGPAARLRQRMAEVEPAPSWRQTLLRFPVLPRPGLATFAVLILLAGLRFAPDQPVPLGSARAEAVPRRGLTPGATNPVTAQDVCPVESRGPVPEVPALVVQQVFASYGITNPSLDAYEVDFLITPELGGANSIHNLWPEPYFETHWNAHVKDDLEERLHRMVCNGDLDLATAQREISDDWISAYKKYFNTDQPLAAPTGEGDGTNDISIIDTGTRKVATTAPAAKGASVVAIAFN
jgi:hypothetical protein